MIYKVHRKNWAFKPDDITKFKYSGNAHQRRKRRRITKFMYENKRWVFDERKVYAPYMPLMISTSLV